MQLALSANSVIDSILASSALESYLNGDGSDSLLSSLQAPALRRLISLAFSHVTLVLAKTGRVTAVTMPQPATEESPANSSADSRADEIFSLDIDLADEGATSHSALLSYLQSAVTCRLIAILAARDGNLDARSGYAVLATDFTNALSSLVTGNFAAPPRADILRPHWY